MILQEKRLSYQPKLPKILRHLQEVVCKTDPSFPKVSAAMKALFPHLHALPVRHVVQGQPASKKPLKVGVVFSGGPAAGGHNVLTGLFDSLRQIHPASELIGFVGGFAGLVAGKEKILDAAQIDAVRNQGGFDLIGTGRTKLESGKDLEDAKEALQSFDALIVVGGDDSNTNGALLAEYFLAQGSNTSIIGVPKTIDGDLRSDAIELSFGFDSACKTYAELIGNLCKDALSTRKYYHFIKLMGRSASHIALECALLTHPNFTVISEERKSLDTLVREMTDLIVRRKEIGKEFGVFLIPEGVIEFMPEIGPLLKAAQQGTLSAHERTIWSRLPPNIQAQLLASKDPHGNVKVSQIASNELLLEFVKQELLRRDPKDATQFQEHFFGYEGRSCLPTNFDANYAYALGVLSALAARDRVTGVIVAMKYLHRHPDHWMPVMEPLVSLLHFEERLGSQKPVIAKVLVDLKSPHFLYFLRFRNQWAIDEHYRVPGPIQFFGELELTDACPRILDPL
jgi:diphosphate-dependent phosphofructokinase